MANDCDSQGIQRFLSWARSNRFRVSRITVGEMTVDLQDLGEDRPTKPEPLKSAHAKFAEAFGVRYNEDIGSGLDDEDMPDTPDPVEGQA